MSSYTYIRRIPIACALALAWACAASAPARGQIAVVFGQHGQKIFVNQIEAPAPSQHAGRRSAVRYAGQNHVGQRPTLQPATPPPEISSLVDKTADQMQVDPRLVHAVIQVESAYNPRAISRKGAQGLMQLMPSTAERFGVQNSFNPRQNIQGGVSYLRYLLGLFGGNVQLSVAAYNAGEHAVMRSGGIPPFTETVNYVQRVTSLYGSQDALVRKIEKPSIYRTVDEHGVVHYTNDGL